MDRKSKVELLLEAIQAGYTAGHGRHLVGRFILNEAAIESLVQDLLGEYLRQAAVIHQMHSMCQHVPGVTPPGGPAGNTILLVNEGVDQSQRALKSIISAEAVKDIPELVVSRAR